MKRRANVFPLSFQVTKHDYTSIIHPYLYHHSSNNFQLSLCWLWRNIHFHVCQVSHTHGCLTVWCVLNKPSRVSLYPAERAQLGLASGWMISDVGTAGCSGVAALIIQVKTSISANYRSFPRSFLIFIDFHPVSCWILNFSLIFLTLKNMLKLNSTEFKLFEMIMVKCLSLLGSYSW